MNSSDRQRSRRFRPLAERCEGRLLLHAGPGNPQIARILHATLGFSPARPNTPVLPFAAQASAATFIDPTVRITFAKHISIGGKDYVAPYATLDAGPPGYIKIGNGSTVQDDAVIQGNPDGQPGAVGVLLGDNVYVGPGATVRGPSTIGALNSATPAQIGANTLIDGATIQPGAIVGPLARVGPGVTIPAGIYVLPGSNITNQAEATTIALGKVRAVTAADLTALGTLLSNNQALAQGYTTLYQGNSATGTSPGVPGSVTTVFNGNLATVEGISAEPGPGTSSTPLVRFEPGSFSPSFPNRQFHYAATQYQNPATHTRLIGQVIFGQQSPAAIHNLGRGNSIRADEGQPITIGSIGQTGTDVSIHSPLTSATLGTITIGNNLVADDNARILGGSGATTTLGDNVSLGANSVVDRSVLGNGTTIGARSYVAGSTLPPGSHVPDGTILINNVVVGKIQW